MVGKIEVIKQISLSTKCQKDQ